MAMKHWTILIVPPDNARTREIRLGHRARRALVILAGVAAFVLTLAIGVLLTPWASPAARVLLAQNDRLRSEMERIDQRLTALNDTLAAIGVRDQQIRLLAGLPEDSASEESVVADAGGRDAPPATIATSAAGGPLPKPFVGRLGFGGDRPDIDQMILRATRLAASFRAVGDTLTRNFERLANTPSIMPTSGWLSSHFSRSRFHPVLHENRAHEGIDVAAPMGAPIIAPASGRVMSLSYESGYGRTFEIDHGNGIVTKYAHCSRIVVRSGQRVTRGEVIATVGNSGLSTGPHLHYEVHVNGQPVNPLRYVLPAGKVAD